MIKVKLTTGQNEFVQYVFVPPFKMLPEILIWGVRIFQKTGVFENSSEDWPGTPVYRECFYCNAFSKAEMKTLGYEITKEEAIGGKSDGNK